MPQFHPRSTLCLESRPLCSPLLHVLSAHRPCMHVARHLAQAEDQPHRRSHLSEALPPLGSDSPSSETGRLEDAQGRILPAALLTKLICKSWNIEGKTSVDQIDDLQSHDWTIAALQETGRSFSAGGHTVLLVSSRTALPLLYLFITVSRGQSYIGEAWLHLGSLLLWTPLFLAMVVLLF